MSDIPQAGFNPKTFQSPPRMCIGGPCDGQEMHCAQGQVLVIARDDEGGGVRAVAGSDRFISVGKQLGTYAGHYTLTPLGELEWQEATNAETEAPPL